MTRSRRSRPSAVVLAVLTLLAVGPAAGCGATARVWETGVVVMGPPAGLAQTERAVLVYLVDGAGRLRPVLRPAPGRRSGQPVSTPSADPEGPAPVAVAALLTRLRQREVAAGLRTELPELLLAGVDADRDELVVRLLGTPRAQLSGTARQQLACTAVAAAPGVRVVSVVLSAPAVAGASTTTDRCTAGSA